MQNKNKPKDKTKVEQELPKKGKKPAYDARLQFSMALRNAMDRINNVDKDNHQAYFVQLFNYYSMVSGWILDPQKNLDIKNNLFNVRDNINSWQNTRTKSWNNRTFATNLKNKLMNIQLLLFDNSKHLLLPTGEDDDDTDFDAEVFASQSET